MKKRFTLAVTLLIAIALLVGCCLTGCYSSSTTKKQTTAETSVSQTVPTTKSTTARKTYSDIPTPFPNLYNHDAESGWLNTYDESKVISYSDAYNYVGQAVTVEGVADSVVYASSSNGSPFFINMGGGAYAPGGFAIVVWGQDVTKFDQNTLRNYVEWSMSDQPITSKFRVSGTVEMYNDRPQIVARDGSQIATQMDDGSWFSMMSDDAIDALMNARYA